MALDPVQIVLLQLPRSLIVQPYAIRAVNREAAWLIAEALLARLDRHARN